jgi:NAD(P)-dependent dehydrogenase (short-subunit alcohol dehydrogenase family)
MASPTETPVIGTESIALVTGANKGLGREISRQLAARGVLVLLGSRDGARGRAAEADLRSQGLAVQFVPLDVTDQDSVDEAAGSIERQHGRLDILVNNAGIALDWVPPSECEVDSFTRTYDTNVVGVFRVTKAMIPLLRKSKAGRIVNVSSGLGSLSQWADPNGPFRDHPRLLAYCSSKSALNMMTLQFAVELKASGIKVNSANPGFTATDMNQHRGTKTVEQGAATPVRLALLPDDGPTGGCFSDEGPAPW